MCPENEIAWLKQRAKCGASSIDRVYSTVVRVALSVFVAHGIALLVGEPAHLQHGDDAGRRSISALIIIIIIIIT